MAYHSEPIPKLGKWVIDIYKNVKFGFKLIERQKFKEDKELEAIKEHQLIIAAYVYSPGTKPSIEVDVNKVAIAFSEILVDYADVIKVYTSSRRKLDLKTHVKVELIDSIVARLNANLGPRRFQLGADVIDTLYKNLEKYIPRLVPSGKISD